MAIRLLQNSDGDLVEANTEKDTLLFSAPHEDATTGTDLFLNQTAQGHFYLLHWSTEHRATQRLEIISPEAARQFLIERCALIGPGAVTDEQITLANKIGLRLKAEIR